MAEACMSWSALIQVINPVFVICYFGLNEVYAWTVNLIDHRHDPLRTFRCATNTMCSSNGLFFQGFQLTSLMLNMCLCADLILTIQSPFTPARNRAKWYYMVSAAVPLVTIAFVVFVDKQVRDNGHCDSCLQRNDFTGMLTLGTLSGAGNLVLAMALSFYILIAVYSLVFAYRRLERPGVSKEARSMFLKKHLYYVLVFITIWSIQLSSNYFTLFNPSNIPSSNNHATTYLQELFSVGMGVQQGSSQSQKLVGAPLFWMSAIMTFSTGFFLTAVRFIEPLFRFLICSYAYQFYGEFYQSKDQLSDEERQVQHDALSSFLSTSLNVELVYILLQSITTFSKKSHPSDNRDTIIVEMSVSGPEDQPKSSGKIVPIDLEGKDLDEQIKV